MRAWRVAALFIAAITAAPLTAQTTEPSRVIHGFVREAQTGEPIPSTIVVVDGVVRMQTDRNGYFSFPRLFPGEHRVQIRAFGYASVDTIITTTPVPREMLLAVAPVELAGITVEAAQPGERPFEAPEVSVTTITPAQVRRVPAALEADVFRAIQALPGVNASNAFSSRMLVRGGSADQNLFLLDGYPVIHPYHLTGAFSAFHLDAVKDVEFWTAAPPARYGGRLSSVLDVGLRDGNREQHTGAASLGLVSSAAVVEGPHRRGAWFAGLRSTYLDLVTRAVGQEMPYRFYDAYGKTYVDLGSSDRVSALVFLGRDGTWRVGDHVDHFDWTNDVYGVSWRRLLGGRGVFEQRFSLSRFTEQLEGGGSKLHGAYVHTDNEIELLSARGDLQLNVSRHHQVEAGYSVERREGEYWIGYLDGFARELLEERSATTSENTFALYAQDDATITDDLRFRIGARAESDGKNWSFQPRVAGKYLLSDRVAFTAGAGLLRQSDHLLQDPDINFDIYTADLWLSATEPGIPVSSSTHLVAGVEARLSHGLRFRSEVYQKESTGLVTLAPFRSQERQFATQRLETAAGTDRGLDISLGRENEGRVRGWVGYSLASSTRTVNDSVFGADPHPRQRFVAVWDADVFRVWGFTGRFEAFEGIPFTPAVSMIPTRRFDFGQGQFSDQCQAILIDYLYGSRNSASTGWSKRLDLGTGRKWTDRRGWKWELSVSLINALFDPTGVFRPAPARDFGGCEQPEKVIKESELILPPIPSASVRVVF